MISSFSNKKTIQRFRWAPIGTLLLFSLFEITVAQPDIPPGVAVQLNATPPKATIGDPIQIDLEVTTPPGYKADILKPEKRDGDFAILGFSKSTVVEQKKTSLRHKGQFIAAIYKTGAFTFPPIRIMLEDGAGKKTFVSSPAVTVEIQSIIDKNAQLKDMKKQAEIPEKFNWILWLAIMLAGGIIVFSGWQFWKRRRNCPAKESLMPVKNPLDVAELDLRSLLDRGLPTAGLEKKFYIQLSDIVKRILESGFGISAEEQTTSEIMDSLRQAPNRDIGKLELIETFLDSCDVVKFAKYIPSKPEHEAAGERSLEILAAARSVRAVRAVDSRQ